MKLSRYTIFYDNFPAAGESLALNTRTQSVAVLGKELREIIERLPANGNLDPETYKTLDQLEEIGILVRDEVDETKVLKHWFDRIKYQARTLTATILTTYQCNFACEYCFEESVKRHEFMDDATTLKVIEFLKREVMRKRPDALRLVFYGGEPFLNPAPILEIGDELNNWCRQRGIKFNFGIITNGSLLNTRLIEQLAKAGLVNLRVTLDGTAAEHDRRRPFKNGYGTFDLILRNIKEVADIVRVDIGGNFDRANLPGLYKLLDILEAEGLKGKLGPILFAPVTARLGGEDSAVELTGCTALTTEFMEESLALRKELLRRGFKVDPGVAITTCPMTRDGAMFVVDPTGDIYKCAAFVGRPEFVIGNVREAQFNYRDIEFTTMRAPMDDAQCKSCVYLPMCGGGCCFSAQLQHQDCSRIACEKGYYEKALPELLKMDYARGALAG